MKLSIILASVTLLSSLASAQFKSKEEIKYLSIKEDPQLSMMRTADFKGLVFRLYEPHTHLQKLDHYEFKGVKTLKMTEALCTELLERIFGPLKNITLKVFDKNIFQTPMGPACEAGVVDPGQRPAIPERRVFLGFINMKPTALLIKFSQKSTEDERENLRQFWQGLR